MKRAVSRAAARSLVFCHLCKKGLARRGRTGQATSVVMLAALPFFADPASPSLTHPHQQLRTPCPAMQQPSSQHLNRKQRRQHLQPPGTPPPLPAQPATSLSIATIAGVDENHAYEQYFFDEPTRARLLKLMSCYERPLLLCAPSLAVALEDEEAAAGSTSSDYMLLDRDERFAFLRGYREFDLDKPTRLDSFTADVVFCDPPFANFPLRSLRDVIDVLAPPEVPVFLAYNGRREDEVQQAFSGRQLFQKLGEEPLGYLSVKPKTANRIWLLGPPGTQW